MIIPRNAKKGSSAPIEALVHQKDKRANIPTRELADFVVMLNAGVDRLPSGTYRLKTGISEKDIDLTADALDKSLGKLKEEKLL